VQYSSSTILALFPFALERRNVGQDHARQTEVVDDDDLVRLLDGGAADAAIGASLAAPGLVAAARATAPLAP
jgi:hypothetical protein